MSWLNYIAPLIAILAIFLAYLGGKSSGRKEAELKQIKKEMGESNETDAIISNNINMSADEFDIWVQNRSKK